MGILKELKELNENSPQRLRFNLENSLRMAFHPTGTRDFMKEMNSDLELGPIQLKFDLAVGTCFDVTKYALYLTAIGRIAYDYYSK